MMLQYNIYNIADIQNKIKPRGKFKTETGKILPNRENLESKYNIQFKVHTTQSI
jgi:hypothetical protein